MFIFTKLKLYVPSLDLTMLLLGEAEGLVGGQGLIDEEFIIEELVKVLLAQLLKSNTN